MYTLWEDLDERFSWLGRFIFTKFKEVERAAVGSSDGKFGADEFELCTGEMGWDGMGRMWLTVEPCVPRVHL